MTEQSELQGTVEPGRITDGQEQSSPHQRVALRTVVDEVGDRIITAEGEDFDTIGYSRFKYGDLRQAHHYSQRLTQVILASEGAALFDDGRPIVVSASAYKQLPTAAQFVADGVILHLRLAGFNAKSGRIHRAKLTEGDYGTMDASERAYWMANNGLSLDDAAFYDCHVIIVDDVRITGSHERAVAQLLQTVCAASITVAHVLEIDPQLVSRDTRIEDRMNHARIKTLHDLQVLMQEQERYVPTARMVKFVLASPLSALRIFLDTLDDDHLRAMYAGLIGDGYHMMQQYAHSATLLRLEVASREHAASWAFA